MSSEGQTIVSLYSPIADTAVGRPGQVHDTTGNRGFSGAGLPYESKYLTLSDLEGDIIQGFRCSSAGKRVNLA